MSKQEIIDYVMNTPYNTNPTILNQKLSEMEVQADWNQNDPTKADYVKNRPFWTDDIKETVLFDGIVTIDDYWNDGELPVTLSVGAQYKVTINGTVYEVVGMEDEDGRPYIGNYEAWWNDNWSDDSVPFAIGKNDNDGKDQFCWVVLKGDDGDHALKIELASAEVVHKIPEKYLPDGIGSGIDVAFLQDGYNGDVVLLHGTYADIYNKFSNKKFINAIYCRYVEDQLEFQPFSTVYLLTRLGVESIAFRCANIPQEMLIFKDDTAGFENLD